MDFYFCCAINLTFAASIFFFAQTEGFVYVVTMYIREYEYEYDYVDMCHRIVNKKRKIIFTPSTST